MYCKINIAFLCYRNNCIEEILDVLEIVFGRHILVELDIFCHLTESFRFPSGKAEIM